MKNCAWGLLLGLPIFVYFQANILGDETQVVEAKGKVVEKNDAIDFNDEQATNAENILAVEVDEDLCMIIKSMIFIPPNGRKFQAFNDPLTYVDVRTNPDAFPIQRLRDSATQIQIESTFKAATAGNYPLAAEGNLTGFVGTNSSARVHWSAKVSKSVERRIVFEVNSTSTQDDFVGLGVRWTTLVIKLLNAEPTDGEYHVTNLRTTGPGKISFGNGATLTAADPEAKMLIQGVDLGNVTITCDVDSGGRVVPRNATVVIPIQTPHGDPTDPDKANNTNEIAFNTAFPGVASVFCKAWNIVEDPQKLLWTIDDAETTKAKWTSHPPGDDLTGMGVSSTAGFTGLPTTNAGFGRKTITLTAPEINEGQTTQDIELFFARSASNNPANPATNPGGRPAN